MRHRISALLLLLFLAVPGPSSFAAGTHDDELPAPDFTLPKASGTVSLHEYRGKVVFVDFWASWCPPCRQSFPWMADMFDRYSSKGLVIVAIDLDKKRGKANAFLETFPAPFVVAFDPSGKTAEAFHVDAMPSSFLVGRDGKIIQSHAGFTPANARVIEDQIREALAK